MNLAQDIAALPTLSVSQLRQRYAEIFGETTNAAHKGWLVKRIAWRLQAFAEGDLSERARQRAAELANDADLRLSPPKPKPTEQPTTSTGGPDMATPSMADERLPPAGVIIQRLYKGHQLQVTVLNNGFGYDGQVFASLSAVAKAITGSHCNGFLFFRLTNTEARP